MKNCLGGVPCESCKDKSRVCSPFEGQTTAGRCQTISINDLQSYLRKTRPAESRKARPVESRNIMIERTRQALADARVKPITQPQTVESPPPSTETAEALHELQQSLSAMSGKTVESLLAELDEK
jgi:hypothetical protein